MFQSIFALYALSKLGLDAKATGYVLGYVGFLVVLVQAGLIGRLTARWSEKQLIFASTILLTFSFVAWAFTPSLAVLLIVLIPLSIGTGVMNTVISSALSKSVYPEEVGGTLGLSASLESFSRDRPNPGRPAAGPGRSVGAGHLECVDHGLADLVHLPAPDRQPRPAAAGARASRSGPRRRRRTGADKTPVEPNTNRASPANATQSRLRGEVICVRIGVVMAVRSVTGVSHVRRRAEAHARAYPGPALRDDLAR